MRDIQTEELRESDYYASEGVIIELVIGHAEMDEGREL